MSALCDINCLLSFCYDRHEHHPLALTWLDGQNERSVIICRNTQMGLLRLLTNSALMGKDVCSLKRAWSIHDALMGDERFDFYAEPMDLERHLRKYTATGRVSPKLWQDAYLAAFARATKLYLATFDGGFKQFDGLRLTLLAAE